MNHPVRTSEEGLRADRVSLGIGGRILLDGVTLVPRPGETIGLLGPNGSGKSTLLRLLAGVLGPSAGVVTLDGSPLNRVGRRAVARRVATVQQHAHTQTELTVRDVVALGRIPHRRSWSPMTPDDLAAVTRALERTGLTDRADQSWHTLSGGERQRAQIARALAQEPGELLLDEPTNHLDIQYQLDLLELVTGLPVTAVIALHDLNLAAMYCDRLVVLKDGGAVAEGTPSQVLTPALIEDVYGVPVEVTPGSDHPVVRFLRRGSAPPGRTGPDRPPRAPDLPAGAAQERPG
ncbi:ABC transporter ATP-binding protein [Nocardiopsis terrae]|uniref:Iron complex transport system ATP-binding protein n=1 Tax=Nocardiopsis terrae TaxID=372655 RepID=A0ABR9HMN2_9ACTN|nr:ABC transporter ATP-binding protein [Nocardiopsis terrae]MBE1460241.1 iron complex transport system ATP-binding protein [Nocardiopsis terrae]GHC70433.1 ABC transporter ATP-binding protein [Nocardiopsis terrae]